MTRFVIASSLGLALLFTATEELALAQSDQTSPQSVVDQLLAADRAFAKASASTDVISGLSAMFANDVVMPVPGGKFAQGKTNVIEALKGNPDNASSRADWTPVRGGVSADGQHGFTFGFMTLTRPDSTKVPIKYLAYWVKQPEGWRVVAYKRRPRPDGNVSVDPMAPALPSRIMPPVTDPMIIEQHRASLDQAERDFSREAQSIGLNAAFAKYGSADAMNMGGPDQAGFVVGSEAIGRAVSKNEPATGSSVSWAPDQVIVASSGDLGVTIGTIRPNAPPAAGAAPTVFPFFTIWRRASPKDPWRYVAE
jgi:ketosteroid isomerase-like protein